MNDVFVDKETGESTLNFTDPENNNLETGEPEEATENHLSRRRVPFQIPRALQRGEKEEDRGVGSHEKDRKYLGKMLKYQRGEPFGQTNPIMLLIPIVFYFRWVIAILMCLEVFLHVWSHHKNKYLKDANVYYRSPFHSITSEFCAMCTSETCMNRVGKLQAIRASKFLRQCNYMKRVVT